MFSNWPYPIERRRGPCFCHVGTKTCYNPTVGHRGFLAKSHDTRIIFQLRIIRIGGIRGVFLTLRTVTGQKSCNSILLCITSSLARN